MSSEVRARTDILDLLILGAELFEVCSAGGDDPTENGPCRIRDGLVDVLETGLRATSTSELLQVLLHVRDLIDCKVSAG